MGRAPPVRRPPFPGRPRAVPGRGHPWLWMVAGWRCQQVPLRTPRRLAAEDPCVSPHPCRAGQSPLVPSQMSFSWVHCPCHSVLDLYHIYPSPPRHDGQLLGALRVRSFAAVAFCSLLGARPSVLRGVMPSWAGWWCSQRTCVAGGPCLRVSLRVMWSRWRAAYGVPGCLRPVCGRRVTRSSRGRLAVRPSQSLGQW